MRPGKVCRIVDVAIRADNHLEFGDNAKKRPRWRLGKLVLKFQSSCRSFDFSLVGNGIPNLLIHRIRVPSAENAPFQALLESAKNA